MTLSVICPIYNEERYIGACIESIIAQDFPKEDLEVIFADGMSSDRTREIVTEYADRFPWIRLIDNPQRIVPPALNKAIKASHGDIIMRLDAHASYPVNYFSALVEALKATGADNVGGVCITLPANESATAQAIAAVLSSRFGMGNSSFRVGANRRCEVDTVPFGCWHRKLFSQIGYFDEDLIRNQDDEFNGRIRKSGGRIILCPDVEIEYFGRDSIGKLAKMFFQYGLFKPLVNQKLGSPATIRQFFPVALILGLIFGAFISIYWHVFTWFYFLGISIYIIMSIVSSIKSGGSIKKILIQSICYPIVHLSYGWGYLIGLWNVLTGKSFNAKSNH